MHDFVVFPTVVQRIVDTLIGQIVAEREGGVVFAIGSQTIGAPQSHEDFLVCLITVDTVIVDTVKIVRVYVDFVVVVIEVRF